MKSRNKKRLLALVLCMVVAISNSSFIFASETGQAEYPQEAEVQTQDEAVADDMDVAAYAADEGQAVADEQPAAVEQVAAEPAAEPETTAETPAAQPVAEAPAAEQPTTEAPAAETPAAQEPADAPTEETAPAAENATAETPEEDTTQAEAENQQLTWSQVVGNTTVNVTAEAGALPADAQLSVTEITAEDEVKEIEKAVEEKAIEEQFSIKNIFSYDIKFLVNGSEVQPTTPVQVSVDTPEITSSEDAAVLHVDDNNVAEDMKGAVDGEGKVVFDAPHFSRYVIVNRGESKVTINLQHYYYEDGKEKQLYADKTFHLNVGDRIDNYSKSANYNVKEVKEQAEDGSFKEVKDLQNIQVTADKTYRIYYEENTGSTQGEVKFWDYDITGNNNINSDSHYSRGNVQSTPDEWGNYTNRMTMGTKGQNGLSTYNAYGTKPNSNDKLNANDYNHENPTLGLLSGLSTDYKTVLWNVDQPGFFTDECEGEGKTIYKNYKLNFNRRGNHYTLDSVLTPSNETKKAGEGFWPFGHEKYYFGMRYDVEFEIGDYVGPMDYKFTGDDDLWVLLDGKVVIDVGGIHDALEESTDLWKDLGYPDGKRPEPDDTAAKTKKHRITVLYMERGAGKSNCKMEFTLPNSRILDVTEVPKATLSLKKVNSKDEAILGATFKLVSKAAGNDSVEVTSDTNGFVTFNDLKEGVEYTLTEESVPGNYIAETTIWTVKLERDSSNTLKAVLYNNDTKLETAADGIYHIVNYKPEELVNQSVESNKTVSLLDWNQRTYKIDLTASSKVTQSTTVSVPFDIVMVLDVSGSGGTVKQIDDYMKGVASSDEKYMTADSVSSLNGLFDSITNSMPVSVTATVTDVIDSRFKLTDVSRAALVADGATIQDNADGSTTITWANTEIPGKKDSGTSDIERAGWHKEIFIKAKDEYIGGNDVPTNGAGSGINIDNNHAEFPQPTVNVKVDFNIGKDETVIFKGDELSQYFNNDVANGITKLVSTTGSEYTMLGDVNVSTKWYTDEACRNETTIEAIRAAKPTADTVYYAKVTVTPKTDGSASRANSVGDGKASGGYYKVDSTGVAKTGTYTVKVVSGAIQIEKQLETEAATNETFTFRITGTDVDEFTSIDVSITINAGETKGTLSNEDLEKLKSLPRGTYEVSEVDTNGYTIQDVNATDETNCYSNVANDKVSFTLGSDSDQKDVIKEKTYKTAGILGVAAFTNEKVTSDWGIKKVSASNNDYMISGAVFKLAPTAGGSSLPTYYGKSQDGGTVKWYSDSDCTTEITETIRKGRYTLSEITAPTGYVRSTETWSIEIASKGALKSIQSGGQEIAENKIKTEFVDGKEVVYYLYENEVVYDLPSTGGIGTTIFTIGGCAIMIVAAGLFFATRRKTQK